MEIHKIKMKSAGIKVFIAGSEGLLGKNLREALAVDGKFKILKSKKQFDFTNLADCVSATKSADIVINAAGKVTSRLDQAKHPADIFYTNSLINFQLLEACGKNNIPRYITFSSVLAYPAGDSNKALKEEIIFSGGHPEISGPLGFYGLSRWLVPYAALSYSLEYGIKSRVIIFPNLYGPGDKFTHAIPPLVANLIKEISLAAKRGDKEYYGGNNKNQKVDILYVKDAVDFTLKVIKNFGKENFLCVNAGSGKAVSIGEICRAAAQSVDFSGKIKWDVGQTVSARILSNALAKRRYGWGPKIELNQGIKNTVLWYKESYEK